MKLNDNGYHLFGEEFLNLSKEEQNAVWERFNEMRADSPLDSDQTIQEIRLITRGFTDMDALHKLEYHIFEDEYGNKVSNVYPKGMPERDYNTMVKRAHERVERNERKQQIAGDVLRY